MIFICYPKCTTCQKARKWLEAQQMDFVQRDIKEEQPTEDELRRWIGASGLKYKELKLKDRLPDMSEDEQIALLATDGMLVKRPILIAGGEDGQPDRVLVGFKEAQWEELL